MPAIFVPGIAKVGAALFHEDFFIHISVSVCRTLSGVSLACCFALGMALLMSSNVKARSFFAPIYGLRYIPVAAFIPLSLLWFGLGEIQKILLIFLGIFVQAVPLYLSALTRVEQNLIDLGRVYGLSSYAITIRVRLRQAAASIYDETRILFGIGWASLLTVEIVGSTKGIGYLMTQAQRYIRTDIVFASMIWIGIIGYTVDTIFFAFMPKFFPWRQEEGLDGEI